MEIKMFELLISTGHNPGKVGQQISGDVSNREITVVSEAKKERKFGKKNSTQVKIRIHSYRFNPSWGVRCAQCQ